MPDQTPVLSCNICQHAGEDLASERSEVRSNVRAFANERFRAWRCKHCASIHAQDDVDLAYYYSNYPFHALPLDFGIRILYSNLLNRMRAAGLRPEHTIL